MVHEGRHVSGTGDRPMELVSTGMFGISWRGCVTSFSSDARVHVPIDAPSTVYILLNYPVIP